MDDSHHKLVPHGSGWGTVSVSVGNSTTVAIELFECVGDRLGPSVLVTAGVHGDEYEGPAAVAATARELSPQTVRGTVRLIPIANPLAFQGGTRTSPVDGLNLARVFPGREDGQPTERLAHFLFREFAVKADYLIDLHSGGVEYEFLPVAGFYGLARPDNLSFQAARAMGLPALWQLPETTGVLSREATRAGKVAIGAEYLGAGRLSEDGALAYARGLRRCFELWRVLDSSATELLPEPKVFADDWLLAEATGVFRTSRKLGETVLAGDELAIIASSRGEVLARITAPHGGVVLGLRSKAYVAQGSWAVLLARELA